MGRTHLRKPPLGHSLRPSSLRRSSSKSKITAERLTLLPGFLHKGASAGARSTTPDDSPPKVRRSARTGKSIFKEIRKKFGELDEDFERGLSRSVPNVRDSLFYRKRIAEEIEGINSVLLGRGDMSNRKRAYDEEEKENYPMKFSYVPPSSWVFQTPPNRKLNYSNMRVDNALKPAVIEKNEGHKIIYQMNKKINVDLSNFTSKDEVDIDKRYMVEVSEEEPEEKMDFQGEPFELEKHFLNLTCRPKKVAPQPHRNVSKRKRDIFEPQPGCSTDSEEYKPNVCFLESLNLSNMEESFTFKFTSRDGGDGGTTGHLFDCEGNKKNSFNFRF